MAYGYYVAFFMLLIDSYSFWVELNVRLGNLFMYNYTYGMSIYFDIMRPALFFFSEKALIFV